MTVATRRINTDLWQKLNVRYTIILVVIYKCYVLNVVLTKVIDIL